ncbi:MAG TPA: hypothetical protein VMT00_13185 [Thermoanaerobaculia bacterium]|nr:hypothetical protein [Thermoanaerobaculia bacterium]
MLLPQDMTVQEMRVLQEFRRIGQETMTLEEIRTIRHPVGGGEAPAWGLVEKGYLQADETRQSVTLTARAKEFLAIEAVPQVEASSGD